jgi:hypothetical protein
MPPTKCATECQLLGGKVNAATFHDYCLDLLKRGGKDFGVLDEKDLWIYLRRRIRELRLEHYIRAANVAQFLNDLLEFVSRCHDELVTPERYEQYVVRLERKEVPMPRVVKSKNVLDDAEVLGRCREIARVFTTMERWLREENLGTFGHMITRAHALLHNDETVLAAARARARFILADEFQDANYAQIEIQPASPGPMATFSPSAIPTRQLPARASSAASQLFDRHFPNAKRVILRRTFHDSDSPQRVCPDRQEPCSFAKHPDGELIPPHSAQSAREEEAPGQERSCPVLRHRAVLTSRDAEGPDVVAYPERKQIEMQMVGFRHPLRSHYNRDDVVRELAEAGIPFVIEHGHLRCSRSSRSFACLNAIVSGGDDVSPFAWPHRPVSTWIPRTFEVMRANAREKREDRVVPLSAVLDHRRRC